jgi:hypothetical protein
MATSSSGKKWSVINEASSPRNYSERLVIMLLAAHQGKNNAKVIARTAASVMT